MYPRLDTELSELITAVMESLDPTPEVPPEVRYKRSLERKPTKTEKVMSIYDNPKFFPPRDTKNKGLDPRTNLGERATAQQIEAQVQLLVRKNLFLILLILLFSNTKIP